MMQAARADERQAPVPVAEPTRHGWLLRAATQNIVRTYAAINPNFAYDGARNPRRMLTKPSRGVCNENHDNEQGDLVVHVNQHLLAERGQRYCVEDLQGQGAFGYVFRCRRVHDGSICAIKVIKNKPNYFNQALTEIHLLQMVSAHCANMPLLLLYRLLNPALGRAAARRIRDSSNAQLNKAQSERGLDVLVRMHEYFVYRRHLCLVFELLGCNLYDALRQRAHRGLQIAHVRLVSAQLLEALELLGSKGVIHCDLKPENVLLVGGGLGRIKLIDLGSAMRERTDARGQPLQMRQTYVQSRFYRAPEVLLGMRFGLPIDMWSLGCICAELYLGTALFPGESEHHQLLRIARLRGLPPRHMLLAGRHTRRFFHCQLPPKADSTDGASAKTAADTAPGVVGSGSSGCTPDEPAAAPALPEFVLKTEADVLAERQRAQLRDEQLLARKLVSSTMRIPPRGSRLEPAAVCPPGSQATPSTAIVSGGAATEGGAHGGGMPWPLERSSSLGQVPTLSPLSSLGALFRRHLASTRAQASQGGPSARSADAHAREVRESNASRETREAEAHELSLLISFVDGLLDLDPTTRWTPRAAASHPFVVGENGEAREVAAETHRQAKAVAAEQGTAQGVVVDRAALEAGAAADEPSLRPCKRSALVAPGSPESLAAAHAEPRNVAEHSAQARSPSREDSGDVAAARLGALRLADGCMPNAQQAEPARPASPSPACPPAPGSPATSGLVPQRPGGIQRHKTDGKLLSGLPKAFVPTRHASVGHAAFAGLLANQVPSLSPQKSGASVTQPAPLHGWQEDALRGMPLDEERSICPPVEAIGQEEACDFDDSSASMSATRRASASTGWKDGAPTRSINPHVRYGRETAESQATRASASSSSGSEQPGNGS